MVKRNSYILLFLGIFGVVNGVVRQELFLALTSRHFKGNISNKLSYLDFAFGFINPFIIFIIFLALFKLSASLHQINSNDSFPKNIALGLIPLFSFQVINLWYIFEMSDFEMQEINKTGDGSIIPFIPISKSKLLANALLCVPFLTTFLDLSRRDEISYALSLRIIVTPVIIIAFFLIIKILLF